VSDYKVIAEVGESLANIFWEEISADPDLSILISDPSLISLQSPAAPELDNDPTLLSIYLYRITEDPFSKNNYAAPGTGTMLRKAPMAMDLSYLITPLLKEPRDQQIVLGKVMQTLYDRPTLEGTDLAGSLGTSGEEVRAIFNPVTLDEITQVWQALEVSYRLSVCYTIRVTMLDSTRQTGTPRVLQSDRSYARQPVAVKGGI
jgi:hypothetical protein